MKLGVITGIKSESNCLRPEFDDSSLMVMCAGARPDRAYQCAMDMVSRGCSALLSFGIAGGLSPEITTGQIIISDQVILPNDHKIQTSMAWRQRLIGALPKDGSIVVAATAGSDSIVADPKTKQHIYTNTGAVAVDMESHRVAVVAQEAKIPLMIIRAVSDASAQEIPRSALNAIGENGAPLYFNVISKLLKHPGDLPKLMQLSRDSNMALASLRRVALAAGPLFCLT